MYYSSVEDSNCKCVGHYLDYTSQIQVEWMLIYALFKLYNTKKYPERDREEPVIIINFHLKSILIILIRTKSKRYTPYNLMEYPTRERIFSLFKIHVLKSILIILFRSSWKHY